MNATDFPTRALIAGLVGAHLALQEHWQTKAEKQRDELKTRLARDAVAIADAILAELKSGGPR